jgi:hypothetical protein
LLLDFLVSLPDTATVDSAAMKFGRGSSRKAEASDAVDEAGGVPLEEPGPDQEVVLPFFGEGTVIDEESAGEGAARLMRVTVDVVPDDGSPAFQASSS